VGGTSPPFRDIRLASLGSGVPAPEGPERTEHTSNCDVDDFEGVFGFTGGFLALTASPSMKSIN
jgi:hypothetical protein